MCLSLRELFSSREPYAIIQQSTIATAMTTAMPNTVSTPSISNHEARRLLHPPDSRQRSPCCGGCILPLNVVMLVLHTACIGAARLRYCSYWILLGLLVLMWLILRLHSVLYRWLLLGLILLPLLLLGFYAALKLLISGLFLRRLLLIWLLLQIATARIVLAKRTPKLNMPMRIYQMEDCIQFTTERMLSLSGRRWEFFCSFSCQLKLYFPPHPA